MKQMKKMQRKKKMKNMKYQWPWMTLLMKFILTLYKDV